MSAAPATDRLGKRPRIATLLSFPLSHPGGISTFVSGLLEALEAGFAVDSRLIAPDGFTAGPGQRASQLRLALRQLVLLLRTRPDVVHTHEHVVLLATAVVYRLLARWPVRVVHTIHVEPVDRPARWKRLGLGWLLSRCSSVTVVAEHTARQLDNVAQPVPSTLEVIHGGTNIRVRRPHDSEVRAFRTAHGLTDGPVVCQVGPLNFPLKVAGVLRLVEAFAAVRARFPTARLLIVGDGGLRAQVEAASERAGVADAVVITGYLKDVSLPLAAADLYCHITQQDACPVSLLEAMRSGKAIVAARTGGIPELISDGLDGVLVEAKPDAVAQAIIRLLDDPAERQALGARAAVTAGERFTWERVASDFAAVYGLASSSSRQ